jgi:hypothetical protein
MSPHNKPAHSVKGMKLTVMFFEPGNPSLNPNQDRSILNPCCLSYKFKDSGTTSEIEG